MGQDEKYLAAVNTLGGKCGELLLCVPEAIQRRITEIRLRVGRAVCVMQGIQPYFIDQLGALYNAPPEHAFIVDKTLLQTAFLSLSGWAVHSHQKEMTDGFIAVRGGHRAGIAATAVVQDGRVTAVRDVMSINLRIAREIFGVADELIRRCFFGESEGVLLAGAPASGKTTLLRDLARQLAGQTGGFRKVCVVDETGELGGVSAGQPGSDLGVTGDLLSGYPKEKGLQIAIRCMSPQVIICDEISSGKEIEAVMSAANSGAAVVTSIHAGSLEELRRKQYFKPLIQTGAFGWLVQLEGAARPCVVSHIQRVEKGENRC